MRADARAAPCADMGRAGVAAPAGAARGGISRQRQRKEGGCRDGENSSAEGGHKSLP